MREQQVGEYIAKKRREIGLTQDELGEKLGFTGKAVSKWERGLCFPDVDTIHALAGILHCKAENLINGSDIALLSSFKKTDTPIKIDEKSARAEDFGIEFSDSNCVVTPLIFGGNLEHTRSAVSGGLSAELLRNRKFVGMPNSMGCPLEWFCYGDKCYSMVGNAVVEGKNGHEIESVGSFTRHADLGYRMPRRYECNSWQITNFHDLAGFGQDEIFIQKDKEYEFRIVLHTDSAVNLLVKLTSRGGKKIYAEQSIFADTRDWQKYIINLTPTESDADAELRVEFKENTRIVVGVMALLPSDNFHGMRSDVIKELKNMNIKFLRWPGGNFAGEYNWFDGLLEVDMRAPSESHIAYLTQPHTLGYDFGEIGIDEFAALCREIGAEPSLTLNLTWNTPEENAAWVEYCNGDATTKFGKLRIDRGYSEPYNVKYWSLGNEAGYGHMEGDNTPEGYYFIAKANAEALLKKDKNIILCSSGFHPDEKWAKCANNKLSGLADWTAIHNYTNYPDYTYENIKEEYKKALSGVEENRSKIKTLRSLLNDDISISFDEWNCWYNWYRPSDVYTGIFAAKMFSMFIAEQAPSKLVASAVFQPVAEGCIEVGKDYAKLTPMGKVFSAFARHGGGKLIHASEKVTVTKTENKIVATFINDYYDSDKTFSLKTDKKIKEGKILVGEGIGPFTDFCEQKIESFSGEITLPPLSVALLILE
ncbi:MAG: helix-turn-helix domain-containing protein [Clostridia bacterium]|nr:helix-turn-helix domain-containing protein [Clostridia bacterium]